MRRLDFVASAGFGDADYRFGVDLVLSAPSAARVSCFCSCFFLASFPSFVAVCMYLVRTFVGSVLDFSASSKPSLSAAAAARCWTSLFRRGRAGLLFRCAPPA